MGKKEEMENKYGCLCVGRKKNVSFELGDLE
jgi:hypothetical protein